MMIQKQISKNIEKNRRTPSLGKRALVGEKLKKLDYENQIAPSPGGIEFWKGTPCTRGGASAFKPPLQKELFASVKKRKG